MVVLANSNRSDLLSEGIIASLLLLLQLLLLLLLLLLSPTPPLLVAAVKRCLSAAAAAAMCRSIKAALAHTASVSPTSSEHMADRSLRKALDA